MRTFTKLSSSVEFIDLRIPIKTSNNEDATAIVSISLTINDLERFVENCHDLPKLVNHSLSSDMLTLSSTLQWHSLTSSLQQVVNKSLASFPTVKEKFDAIGVQVASFTFSDIDGSAELKAHYNNKIKAEANAKIQAANDERARKDDYEKHVVSMKIAKESTEMQKDQIKQDGIIADMKIEAARMRIEKEQDLRRIEVEFENEILAKKDEAKSNFDIKKNDQAIAFLGSLKKLDVDLTSLLNSGNNANLVAKLINHAPAMESFMDTMERKGLWNKMSESNGFEFVSEEQSEKK
jgi:regulator of protease activity HflC (stomatin/prohibitin superfamily)